MRKVAFLIIAFSFASYFQAQDTTSFNFTFNHFALSVKNLDRSVEFYKKVLNLKEITNRTKIDAIRWLSLGEDKELHLISILKKSFRINKAIHLGLATSNFDNFVKRLDILNIAYSDWPAKSHTITNRADGVKQLYFQDPDGYWIEVNNIGENKMDTKL